MRAYPSMMNFLRWWIDELTDLLPVQARRSRVPMRRFVVTLQGDKLEIVVEDKGHTLPIDPGSDPSTVLVGALEETLRRGAATHGALPVSLRVRASDGFVRHVDLPASAQRDFDRMLRLDLERTTPLKASDVVSAYHVEGPGAGRGLVRVRHVVLKTRTLEPLRQAISRAGLELQSIEAVEAGDQSPLPFEFLATSPAAQRRGWTPAKALAAVAVALIVAGIGTYWMRREVALAALEAEIARLEQRAREAGPINERARSARADLVRLRRLEEDRMPALVILEEVTKLLPDTAWVQEFRFDGAIIELSGLAQSAATLLSVFERSVLFHEARFTASIRIESGEDRERFRLQAKLRPPNPSAVGK